MNQKQIGVIVIIIGIILMSLVSILKQNEDKMLEEMIYSQGTCFLEDGTCLHADKDITLYLIGWILSAGLIFLGVYLIFFDKTQELLIKQNEEVTKSLVDAKKKEEFNAFLSGFDEQQQKVLRIIYNEEGISQSTLRYRADTSKTSLSLVLKELEEKNIIARKPEGKTYKIFLKKKW